MRSSPRGVLADHAIQALVTGLPQVLRRPGSAAVPHGRQHRQDETFQERGLSLTHPVQHLSSHGRVGFIYRGGDRLTRSRPFIRTLSAAGLLRRMGAALEIDELRELRQHPDINPVRMRRSHLPPAVRDTDHAALRATEQASLIHIGDGPVQPVGKQRSPAGDLGPQILLGQSEPTGNDLTQLRKRMLAAIGEDIQRGGHQRLIVRYRHLSSLPADGLTCTVLRIPTTRKSHYQLGKLDHLLANRRLCLALGGSLGLTTACK